MKNIFLQTERIILREFNEQDIPMLFELDSDPDVMEFIRTPSKLISEAEATFQKIVATRKKDIRFGNWVAILKNKQEPIGWFCLKDLDNSNTIEVGYRLLKRFWRNGYATEGARELIRYGFVECGLNGIAGVTHPNNIR